ncbi:unnamed protein product, partial [Staurois parvus]
MMVGNGVTFLCGIPRIQRTGTSLWWVPITGSIYLMMVRDWCDLPVWNPGNTEDRDISLVGSHYWVHLPDDGEGWCDLPCGIPGIQRTETSLWWVPITGSIYLMMVTDGVTFLCGIPGIQRTGTSLWWVPITRSTYLMMVRDGVTFLCGIPGI